MIPVELTCPDLASGRHRRASAQNPQFLLFLSESEAAMPRGSVVERGRVGTGRIRTFMVCTLVTEAYIE